MEKNIKISMTVTIQKKSSKGYRGFPHIVPTPWSPNLIMAGAPDSHGVLSETPSGSQQETN